MGLELTTDRYKPIKSQTRYPLRHAASCCEWLNGCLQLKQPTDLYIESDTRDHLN